MGRTGDRDARELGGAWARFQRHEFVEPGPGLAPFVAHYWVVDWDYARPYRQKVVPYPNVHVTVRPGRVPEVHGVVSRHVERVLEGRDRVVGAAFRPGLFRPFLQAAVATLTDRTVPATEVPGLPVGRPEEPLDAASMEAWLRMALPRPDPDGARAGDAVALVVAEPGITRVDQLAARCGTSVRGLQRLFAEHVGIGPKWVIRRYRLHEVTRRMAEGQVADWARVAAELGYADQAHLTRDFTAVFGEPPTAYAVRY